MSVIDNASNEFVQGKHLQSLDHPIFVESIRRIQANLGLTGLDPLQQQVLERLIHSSGDFLITSLLRFSPSACQEGLAALNSGAPILTDTAMAAAAVKPMAIRTLETPVNCLIDWSKDECDPGTTRTAQAMKKAWLELTEEFFGKCSPVVLIGSAPSALEILLDLVADGARPPSLIIGMPVGFVGVIESKRRLSISGLTHIRLEGTRGGASLAAATANALLRASVISKED